MSATSPSKTSFLAFDADTHTYRIDGRIIHSVTTRIQAAGLCGPAVSFYSEESGDRGTRVHLACLDDDEGRPVTLPADEYGYLDSYRRWRDLLIPVWSLLEVPRYSPRFDTAGTADRIGTMADAPVVLDLKTGRPSSWHGVQLACYDLLYDEVPPQTRRRIALYLQPNGRTAQSVDHHAAGDYVFALDLMGDTRGPDRTKRRDRRQRDRDADPQQRVVQSDN